jgi:predicted MFS family arabinose efflux permease
MRVSSLASIHERSLWRHADFVKLWLGSTISMFGSYFTSLALQFVAAVSLNATPIEMGVLAAVRTAPSLLIGLWVDRHRRRSTLIVADLGRALILSTIPVAALAGALSMYQLYAVGFAVGLLTVFFDVAYRAYLPSLVSRSQLIEGNGKLEMGRSTAAVAGPSLAGIVIQAITAPLAIVLDVLSYVISALSLYRIRGQEEAPEDIRAPMLEQVREGLSFTFRNPSLRAIVFCSATNQLCSRGFFALYVLFGTRELGLDAAALGIVFGVGSVAALFGALFAGRATARLGFGTAIIVASFVGALEFLPVVFATPDLAVPLLVLSGLLGNFAWPIYGINQVGLRQAITPFALQGRMNATMNFIIVGVGTLGAMAGGTLAQTLGLREAIVIIAFAHLLASLWIWFSPIRGLTRVPEGALA